MRLAVFDTNVVVSAGIGHDTAPEHPIQDWVLPNLVQAVTCPSIVDEYYEVMHRRKFARYGFPPRWLEFLIQESLQLPEPTAPWPSELPDPKDAPFLALAKASGAYLVTGNLKHFPDAARHGVRVVTPAEYLDLLRRT